MAELSDFADELARASGPTAKPGTKPQSTLADFKRDIGLPEVGPVEPNQLIKPLSVRHMDMFKPEEGVAYKTGAPMHHRDEMARMSASPGPREDPRSEQEIYLEKNFGAGNFRRDAAGKWLVKPNWDVRETGPLSGLGAAEVRSGRGGAKITPGGDQWTALYPQGGLHDLMENTGSTIRATGPVLGGAVAGALAGAPGGPGTAAIGAGIGSGAGHLIDEGVKSAQGYFNKTPAELTRDAALAAGINGMFQGAPYLWNATKQGLARGFSSAMQHFTEVTPESRAIAQSLDRLGVVPPLGSVAPGLTSWEAQRQLRNRILNDPGLLPRTQAVRQRVGEILDTLPGMADPAHRATAENYVYDATSASSPGQTGELIRNAVARRENEQQGAEQAALTQARNLLQQRQTTLLNAKGTQPRNLMDVGNTVATDYQAAKQAFVEHYDAVYDAVTNVGGGVPNVNIGDVVPMIHDFMNPMPTPMKNILAKAGGREAMSPSDIPDDVAPNVAVDDIKKIMEAIANRVLNTSPQQGAAPAASDVMVTPKEAHRLRSALREMARLSNSLSPMGPRRYEILQMANEIDASMTRAGNEAAEAGGPGVNFKSLLDDADASYKKDVVKFTNDDVNEVISRAKDGRPPDPQVVADMLLHKNGVAAARQVLDTLSPEGQTAVQAADMRNILDASLSQTKYGPAGERTLDPDKLARELDRREMFHEEVYGPKDKFIEGLRETIKDMKALDGDIDPNRLANAMRGTTSVDIRNALKDAVKSRAELESYVRDNLRASLNSDNPELQQQGARYVLQNEARARRAAQILNPAERQVVEREAVIEMLRQALTPIGRPERGIYTIGGEKLRQSTKLTPATKNMWISNETQDNIDLLIRQTKSLFPEHENDFGSSLAASSAKLKSWTNPTKIWTYARAYIQGALADNPAVIRALTGTLRADPYTGRRLLGYILQTGADLGMTEYNASGSNEPQGGQNTAEQMKLLSSVHKTVPKAGAGYNGPPVE